jgi:formyl-CoA transferase
VIKVEPRVDGEYGRQSERDESGFSPYFESYNRGKRSITLDISTPEGQQIVRDLVRHCDVVLENYKVGQLKKYGLDYESLRTVKPDLVFCSVTGFGQDGPYARRPGYDFIIQGMGGFMSITGELDDQPGGGPQKAGVAISDLMTGMYATIAVLAALTHRDRTGEGQYIDMALLDVQVAMMANMATNFLASGDPPTRWGNAHPNIVPYQTFPTADGHIIVAVGNDGQYRKFVNAGDRPDLADDPRFATNPLRVRNRDLLVPLLAHMVKQKTKQEWIDLLEQAGVPCGPINRLDEVFENPQVQARGMKVELPHPAAGKVSLVKSPMNLSATPPRHEAPPPLLGQHTDQVLTELLGRSAEQLAALRAKGVL